MARMSSLFTHFPVLKPVAVLMLCPLVPFGCVEAGQPDLVTIHSNPVAAGDVRLDREGAATPGSDAAPVPSKKGKCGNDDRNHGEDFHGDTPISPGIADGRSSC